jgi:uncharacterized protein (TIGR02172 family)
MPLELIARGRTAEVYAWGTDKVVKVYFPGFSAEDAQYEAKVAAAVQESGVACPRFYEQVEFEGRPGLVYERIEGVPMSELVMKAPWRVPALAKRMAKLHREMHQPLVKADLPNQREKYTRRIEHSQVLPAPLKSRLLAAYAKIPDENRLCHGDFHPGNILSTAEKDLTIDWMDVSVGHPLGDVARTTILLSGMAATVPIPPVRWLVNWFHSTYLQAYFASGGDQAVYRAFLPIVAAARLAEGIPELQNFLLKQAEAVYQA